MINLSSSSFATQTVILCRLIIAVTALYWLSLYDVLRFPVAIVALLLTLVPERLIQDRLLGNLTKTVVAVLLAAHIAIGMQAGLYETSIFYDKIVHTLGSGGIAIVILVAIQQYCICHGYRPTPTLIAVLVIGGTLSAGTLWEFFEYAIDATGWFQAQRGLDDTMIDLIADAFGAALTSLIFIATVRFKNNGNVTPSRSLPQLTRLV